MTTRMNVTAIVAVVLFAGCALQQSGGPGGLDDGKADGWGGGDLGDLAVIIGESDDGQTFDVREGQRIIVRLPSNLTAGWDWEVLSTDRTFGYPDSAEYIAHDPNAFDSAGFKELIWETDRGAPLEMVGIHTVVLGNMPLTPIEDEREPLGTFTFTVNISAVRNCGPVMCTLYCEHGFQTDEYGCEICVCAEPRECEPVTCELYCEHGFDVDEDGCEICACARPECEPNVMCGLHCDYGFAVDEDGCEICACAD